MNNRSARTILIIEDDKNFRESVIDYFNSDKLKMLGAGTGAEGIKICSKRKIDIVILDQNLPDGEGVGLCPAILRANDQAKIIFITAYPNFENAVDAIRNGAFDYLSKPIELDELELTIKKAFRSIELEGIEQIYSYQARRDNEQNILIGAESGLAGISETITLAATSDAPVLITGETGTGKNVVAKRIHYSGGRKAAPFLNFNCSAVPRELIESELFGHEKGAFTGATATRKGIFEMADGGTLLLDEIGTMPLSLQSKLLSVLEEKQVKRIGGQSIRPVNVRIIAATNSELEKEIVKGRFRRDLFYRLNVIRIHIPPLRERLEDIAPLFTHFVKSLDYRRDIAIADDELSRLKKYGWPGNVRELRNLIERATTLQRGSRIELSRYLDIHTEEQTIATGETSASEPDDSSLISLGQVEKTHILNVLNTMKGNIVRTAEILQMSESTLRRRLKSYKEK
jgi:two-component system, NtrC family, response regulator AtoC